MAGTAKNYDVAHIHQGTGDLWIIGGGAPTDSAQRLTLDATTGTPDATAHPSSIHLGLWDKELSFSLVPKFGEIMADQATGPIESVVISETGKLSVELKQLDPQVIQQGMAMGAYSTASGYAQLTFGGTVVVPFVCVAAIAPKRGAAGKFIVYMLYNAKGTVGLSTVMGKSKDSIYKAEFDGFTDLTRTAGRQIGIMYETK